MELYLVVQVVLGGLLLAALVWGRDSLLWVSGFLIPLYGMSAFVGVRLTWDKAVPVALAIDLLVRGGAGRALRMPGRLPLFLLLGYTAIISGLVWWLDADAEHWRHVAKGLGWGAGQTDYRYLVQGSVFFQTWIMPVLGFCMVQSRKSFKSASGGFLWGASVSVGAGIYQAFARSLGLPWWDSAVADVAQGAMGVRERVQQFALGPISVDRLYGLGGEPKHTAVLTLVALCLVFALIVQGEKLRARVLVVCLLLVGLLLTFSTSGWVASLAVFSVVVFRGGGKAAGRLVGVVAVLFGVALLLVGPVAMFDLYDQRVSSRLYGEQSALEQEHKDGAFFAYVQDHPEKLLVGHGAGGVDFFLIPYVDPLILQKATSITPTYFVTRMVGDVGVIGLGLALLVIFQWWVASLRSESNGLGLFLVSGAVLLLLTPQTVLFAYLFLVGCYLGWVGSSSVAVLPKSEAPQARGRESVALGGGVAVDGGPKVREDRSTSRRVCGEYC